MSPKKKIFITFGRMNPPHLGHKKLINKGIQNARQEGANFMAIVTRSYSKGSNPLPPDMKVAIIKELYKKNYPNLNVRHIQTYGEALTLLKAAGYTNIQKVVGTNREGNFGSGSKTVVPRTSANISATKVRNAIRKSKNFEEFVRNPNVMQMYPSNFNVNLLRMVYSEVKNSSAPNTPTKKRATTTTARKKSKSPPAKKRTSQRRKS